MSDQDRRRRGGRLVHPAAGGWRGLLADDDEGPEDERSGPDWIVVEPAQLWYVADGAAERARGLDVRVDEWLPDNPASMPMPALLDVPIGHEPPRERPPAPAVPRRRSVFANDGDAGPRHASAPVESGYRPERVLTAQDADAWAADPTTVLGAVRSRDESPGGEIDVVSTQPPASPPIDHHGVRAVPVHEEEPPSDSASVTNGSAALTERQAWDAAMTVSVADDGGDPLWRSTAIRRAGPQAVDVNTRPAVDPVLDHELTPHQFWTPRPAAPEGATRRSLRDVGADSLGPVDAVPGALFGDQASPSAPLRAPEPTDVPSTRADVPSTKAVVDPLDPQWSSAATGGSSAGPSPSDLASSIYEALRSGRTGQPAHESVPTARPEPRTSPEVPAQPRVQAAQPAEPLTSRRMRRLMEHPLDAPAAEEPHEHRTLTRREARALAEAEHARALRAFEEARHRDSHV